MVVEQGIAESETPLLRESGQYTGSSNMFLKPSNVFESFHDPGQLCLDHTINPSAAMQTVPVTNTECNQPL
ncbi:hypothetical protein PR002_g10195 [Phytophthora rubi]|nr:hypothetical protein PR002_g10195 [Phytophthora rubi]